MANGLNYNTPKLYNSVRFYHFSALPINPMTPITPIIVAPLQLYQAFCRVPPLAVLQPPDMGSKHPQYRHGNYCARDAYRKIPCHDHILRPRA